MRDILDQITKWWDSGETFGLATVVNTFRSAPRDPGAALAVSGGGEVVGSVSGGCVEGAVYELAREVCETGQPVLQTYGISDDTAFDVGLTCGGIIELFVEPVSKERFAALGDGGGRHPGRGAGRGGDGHRRARAARRPPDHPGRRRRRARSARRSGSTRRSTTTRAACSRRA